MLATAVAQSSGQFARLAATLRRPWARSGGGGF